MRWGSILTVIILTGICVLSLLLNYQSATASEMLPVSIQANEMADYSADGVSAPNPGLNIEIIEAAIKDQEPTNIAERLENVRANLQTAVPTVTPTRVGTSTPGPGEDEPDSPQPPQTNSLQETATAGSLKTPTASKTALPTGYTATTTKTGTAVPTNTSEKTATATNIPQGTSTATKKATQTATKFSATATDTATNIPPTATKIPPTATKIPPTATDAPTVTPTNVPPTATPIVSCTRPSPWMGYVWYTIPRNGAVNVSRDVIVVIKFNQPMYEGDLFKNIKVSGTNVDYVISYDPGTYRLEIDFLELLEPGADITVEVKRNTKNICMWRQIVLVDFEFTIEED
jgi:hypothetical protein